MNTGENTALNERQARQRQAKAQLASVLRQEIACSIEMIECLEKEADALCDRRVTHLEDTVERKRQCAQQLERLGAQREQWLDACHTSPQDDAELAPLWKNLLRQAEHCRLLNRRNGALLVRCNQQTLHALAILQGADPDARLQAQAYNRNGQGITAPASRHIAEA